MDSPQGYMRFEVGLRIYLDVKRFLQRHLLSGSTNTNINSVIPWLNRV